ncbi:Neurogenic_locus notch-like protein [Hexamita inflata]|uniref:Neurogenic locus notch-like protein n=1 Tax=Hexamita inflata TaxID=28002 RepID=A0AA86QD06_9EUKA|nr:Neurogenic locus notch-like protein [Hexamita inflata]CAI9956929.1 Neurogenic locus notch-like protein [Hexamita inflata]
MLLIQLSFQICTDKANGIKEECNRHGKCENDVCICQTGFDATLGPLCTVCAEGYQMSEDNSRCVHVATCMTHKVIGDIKECYGHGYCQTNEKTKYDANTTWFCRCINHFQNGTRLRPLNCSVCPKEYLITTDQKKCIPEQCQSSQSEDKLSAIECGNQGHCWDHLRGSKIFDPLILKADELIGRILNLTIRDPGCVCRNMNEKCTACAPDYRYATVENRAKCYENQCFNYDEKRNPISEECNGKNFDETPRGSCNWDAFNEIYQCACSGNYDKRTACKTCISHYSVESECKHCLPGYDIKTNCFQCTFGRDDNNNCQTCLPGYDPAHNCQACLGNKDILSRCRNCSAGMAEVDGKCVSANKAGSQTVIIVLCVIAGVVLVVIGVWLVLFYLRKKRAATVDLDEVETLNENANE